MMVMFLLAVMEQNCNGYSYSITHTCTRLGFANGPVYISAFYYIVMKHRKPNHADNWFIT